MRVAVLGLGVDTQDVIPYLEKRGDEITVLDEGRGDKFEGLENYDLIIRSPGVYRYRPEIVRAEKAGVEVSSKTKLFFDVCPARIIGVTGTKGKGTTASLIYEMLKAVGKDVYLAGNIGSGIFGVLEKLGRDNWVVLELSSFQLIDLRKSPHIAVVLMTTSEHLDWHKDTNEYVEAKKNIVAYQEKRDFAVINRDYSNSVKIGKAARGKVVWVSGRDKHFSTKLRGEHNQENIAAAVAVTKIIGVPFKEVVSNFPGLEHRLEEVRTVGGVTFYNDSFSTTPETAIAAIKSFSEPEIVILGGSSKNSDFTQLVETIKKALNIKQVSLVGVEGENIYKLLKGLKCLKLLRGPTSMEKIVNLAYNTAVPGDVVLLSPACASFDMFANYKDRGLQFKQAVLALNEKQNP